VGYAGRGRCLPCCPRCRTRRIASGRRVSFRAPRQVGGSVPHSEPRLPRECRLLELRVPGRMLRSLVAVSMAGCALTALPPQHARQPLHDHCGRRQQEIRGKCVEKGALDRGGRVIKRGGSMRVRLTLLRGPCTEASDQNNTGADRLSKLFVWMVESQTDSRGCGGRTTGAAEGVER
jgi:hypothetical protein